MQMVKLKDICIGKGEYGIAASAESFSSNKYRYLRITDISDFGELLDNDCKSVSCDGCEKYLLSDDEIVFARTGNSTGRAFFYEKKYGPLVYAGFLIKFHLDKNKVNPKYLKYYTISKTYKDWIANGPTGSTRGNMSEGDFADMPVFLPSRQAQDALVAMMEPIDEKIVNNDAICSNLEAVAKLLYDYWFVQFDFPDENGKPYKSSGGKMVWNEELKREIPAGWEVNKLPNVCDIQYGFPLSTELFGEDGKCVIRIRDISANTVSAKTREIVGKEYLTHAGDLLVGMDGNFQMNFWTRDNEIVNQRITRIRQTIMPLLVVKMQIEPYITAKVSNVARSTVGHLGDADFKKQPILCPDKMDYSFFEIALNAIVELRNENQQLASLRDFLLPMLMNGQITITPQKKEA